MRKHSILFQKCDLNHFTKGVKVRYSLSAFAKSKASREKLNDLSVANDSTPLIRAFFVRGLRLSKINPLKGLFSMVGRKGQRLGVGCLPQMAVSHPFTSYRQAVRSEAVALKSICGATKMNLNTSLKPLLNSLTLCIIGGVYA